MFSRVPLQFITLVISFTFCQVIGTMCVLPDLSEVEEPAILAEENMACPMDGTIMCPASVTASPGRQTKNNTVVSLDPVLSLVNRHEVPADVSVERTWPRSCAYSIVPLSISSSSVLRILSYTSGFVDRCSAVEAERAVKPFAIGGGS
ncbi:MAG: hypothetical protein CV088_13040 [Nitrospira sp. LK70]|nr:hypothetical protein [Nitrospira sp. LK70]